MVNVMKHISMLALVSMFDVFLVRYRFTFHVEAVEGQKSFGTSCTVPTTPPTDDNQQQQSSIMMNVTTSINCRRMYLQHQGDSERGPEAEKLEFSIILE